MSAFAESLAQARDNVRHIVEGPGAVIPGQNLRHVDDCPGCAILAALDRVERLATDMEAALRGALGYIGIDWDESYPDEPSFVTTGRAVLSAREEGQERWTQEELDANLAKAQERAKKFGWDRDLEREPDDGFGPAPAREEGAA